MCYQDSADDRGAVNAIANFSSAWDSVGEAPGGGEQQDDEDEDFSVDENDLDRDWMISNMLGGSM